MEEKNRPTLEQSLKSLPAFRPPATLWNAVEAEMDFHRKEEALQRALRRLPEFEPSPAVWEAIAMDIHTPPAYRFIRKISRSPWTVAATIAFVVFSGTYLYRESQKPTIHYLAGTEQGLAAFPMEMPEQDESAIQEVGTAFTAYHQQFNDPQGKELIGALEELDQASQELREVLKNYGFDENLAQELTRVELERDQVIRKMAAVL